MTSETERHPRRGITLLELLIALALVVSISTMLLSATRLGIRSYERSETIAEENRPAALRLQLRRWLQTATPPTLLATFNRSFAGDDRHFAFTTISPAGFAKDSAALRLMVEKRDSALLFTVIQMNDTGEEISQFTRTLDADSETLALSYLRRDEEGRVEWVTQWDAPTLPLALRIADSADLPVWPEFTVALIHAGN